MAGGKSMESRAFWLTKVQATYISRPLMNGQGNGDLGRTGIIVHLFSDSTPPVALI